MNRMYFICFAVMIMLYQANQSKADCSKYVANSDAITVFDQPLKYLDEPFPKAYRSLGYHFDFERYNAMAVDLYGMDRMNISGSAQFTKSQLRRVLNSIKENQQSVTMVLILDLRQESHGFINGLPFRFYIDRNEINKNVDPDCILQKEEREVKSLTRSEQNHIINISYSKKESYKLNLSSSVPFQTQDIHTECETVNALANEFLDRDLQVDYERFYVLDHNRPSDEDVDKFVSLFDTHNNEYTWLHIHCAGGKGRTTSFMAMADMLLNASQVEFKEIIKRQHVIGGSNLYATSGKPAWRAAAAKERLKFLEQFYNFATSPNGRLAGVSWSEFVDSSPK